MKKSYTSKIIKMYKDTKKSSLLVYLILRGLVIACMILQIRRGEWNNAFLCLLSLILFVVPSLIENKLKVNIPNLLKCVIYMFIFSAEILGEINNFYNIFTNWDVILHTLNGFLAAGIGFSTIELLNENSGNFKLSPFFCYISCFLLFNDNRCFMGIF